MAAAGRSRRSPLVPGPWHPALVLVGSALILAACGPGSGSGGSAAPSTSSDPVVVTFEVAGGERFRVLLTQADDIANARSLLAGEDVPGIPNGRVLRETGVNTGWSWSLDPADIAFADQTIEVCDGLPSDVEAGLVTSGRYCPWNAQVVAVDTAP